MKNLFLTLFITLLFSSCVTIEFTQPQPIGNKNLKKYPKELRGTYQVRILSEGDLAEPAEDTLKIAEDHYEEFRDSKNWKRYLSDSCIIRSYKKQYFINFKGKGNSHWTSALIKKESSGNLIIYGLYDGEDVEEEDFINAVKAITVVQKETSEDGSPKYNISPSNEELSRLVDEQFFKPVYELIRLK